MQAVHTLSKAQILRLAVQKRATGELYDPGLAQTEETFLGSIDRFCDIAVAFRHARRVLDVGSGNGLLPAVLEMKRVLRDGGMIELDVPNAASLRNRSRMLRGKQVTFDYREHYLYAKPVVYKGREYYPDRHNREFTRTELELLLSEAGFRDIEVRFLKSRRFRTGLDRLKSVGTALRDLAAPLRKSLIAFARK